MALTWFKYFKSTETPDFRVVCKRIDPGGVEVPVYDSQLSLLDQSWVAQGRQNAWVDSTAELGKTYRYSVQPCDADGIPIISFPMNPVSKSNEAMVTNDGTPAPYVVITELSVVYDTVQVDRSNGKVSVEWSLVGAAPGGNTYRVEVSASAGPNPQPRDHYFRAPPPLGEIFSDLKNGVEYTFRVVLTNQTGAEVSLPGIQKITALDNYPPRSPQGISVTIGTTPSICWQAPTDADRRGFRIYRTQVNASQGCSSQDLAKVIGGINYCRIGDDLTSTCFVDQTAASGTTYSYAVVAVDYAGNESIPDVWWPPLDVALVIDRSGSMAGERIETATNAAGLFLDILRVRNNLPGLNDGSKSRAGIVTFGNTATTGQIGGSSLVVVGDANISSFKSFLGTVNSAPSANEYTNVIAGLEKGWELLAGSSEWVLAEPQRNHNILLLTDTPEPERPESRSRRRRPGARGGRGARGLYDWHSFQVVIGEEMIMSFRKPALNTLVVVCFFLAIPAKTEAEIYKWVDEQGNLHFQDHPPQNAAEVSGIEVRESSPAPPPKTAPAPSAAAGGEGRGSAATPVEQQSVPLSAIEVELYYVDWCPWCKKAREYFRSLGVKLTEYDIEKDAAAAARKKDLDSEKGVPFAVVNGVKIRGYSTEKYARALRSQPPGNNDPASPAARRGIALELRGVVEVPRRTVL